VTAIDDLTFSFECWRGTDVLLRLITDLDAVLSRDGASTAADIDAQMIRNFQIPLRRLLDRSYPEPTEGLARKNRSRLKVFDRRVGEGISHPAWLDLPLLKYTLEVWQQRLIADCPGLADKISCGMPAAQECNQSVSPEDVFKRFGKELKSVLR
jgi:hypothetical protein